MYQLIDSANKTSEAVGGTEQDNKRHKLKAMASRSIGRDLVFLQEDPGFRLMIADMAGSSVTFLLPYSLAYSGD